MKSLVRRNLLLLMLGVTAAALTLPAYSPAFAKNGGSGSGSSGSGGSNSGSGSDNSGSDSDNSGSGGDDGPDHDDGDDNGGDDDDNDDNDDDNDDDDNDDDDDNSASNSSKRGGRNVQRPEIELSLDAATLAGVRNGSLAVVDNLGRVLEVEVDFVNGAKVVTAKPHGGDAKRKPGAIASVSVVPSSQAPVHQ